MMLLLYSLLISRTLSCTKVASCQDESLRGQVRRVNTERHRRRVRVTLQAILAANPNITDSRLVKVGQTILIRLPGWAPNSSPSLSPSSS